MTPARCAYAASSAPPAPTAGPFHARPDVRAVLGATLRPGGVALTARLLDLAGLPRRARVLDLGCGPGASLALLGERGFRSVGVDMALPDRRDALPRVQAQAACLPFADASFDAVLCECALSCMGVEPAVLAEIRRVLQPGGRVLLTDLYERAGSCSPGRKTGGASCENGALSLDGWQAALQDARFRVRVLEDHSRRLVELAARLVFAGALCWRPGQDCAALGYFLCIAVKEGEESHE